MLGPLGSYFATQTGVEALSKGGVTIGDDTWPGANAAVLDGVTICDGAVVPRSPAAGDRGRQPSRGDPPLDLLV